MAQKNFAGRLRALERFEMEQFNITMRKYLKEVGITAQQAIERVVREEKWHAPLPSRGMEAEDRTPRDTDTITGDRAQHECASR